MLAILQVSIAFMDTKTVRITMTKLFKQIGDDVIEFTDSEYVQLEADNKKAAEKKAEAAAAKAAAEAKLAALGLTADDLTALGLG